MPTTYLPIRLEAGLNLKLRFPLEVQQRAVHLSLVRTLTSNKMQMRQVTILYQDIARGIRVERLVKSSVPCNKQKSAFEFMQQDYERLL